MDLSPKEREQSRGQIGKGEPLERRVTYELVYPVAIRGIDAALVVANNIATGFLVVAFVGARARYNHTPLRALGRQSRTGLW